MFEVVELFPLFQRLQPAIERSAGRRPDVQNLDNDSRDGPSLQIDDPAGDRNNIGHQLQGKFLAVSAIVCHTKSEPFRAGDDGAKRPRCVA